MVQKKLSMAWLETGLAPESEKGLEPGSWEVLGDGSAGEGRQAGRWR